MRLFWSTVPALVILGFFAAVANLVPQVGWQPVRAEAISPETPPRQLVRLGEDLVRARGCLTCHVVQPGVDRKAPPRAPNLQGIGRWATVEYLVESLYDPGASVVEGYPPIMPTATAPPANLSYEEVVAVLNYLQSLGGTPRVRLGAIPRPADFKRSSAAGPAQAPSGGAAQPQGSSGAGPLATLTQQGCLACHAIGGQGATLGPALDRAGIKADAQRRGLSLEDYIRESIANPAAFVVEGYQNLMPPDLAQRIPPDELKALVQHLAALERR